MIFETKRLLVRKLKPKDLEAFFELESNPRVLQYATGEVKTFSECELELANLITKYSISENTFWIYAVERKSDGEFIGTVALVKDADEDEIGYRLIERYWGIGYATELCSGLITYCKQIGLTKLIGYVVDENKASANILKRYNFKPVKRFISEDIGLHETKYELYL